MESQRLQGCNPRLYRLKTDGLAPVSKYWTYRSHVSDMSPISLVSPACDRYVNRGCLYPHCFNGWLRRETRYGPTDRSAIVLWIVLGALFLRSSGSVHHCDDFVKGCYALTAWDTYGLRPYADWAWDACGVLVGFSPAGCISIRITATLGYEYRLFVLVFT
jgi:hypothetical protein